MNSCNRIADRSSPAWPLRILQVLFTLTAVLAMTACGSDSEEPFQPAGDGEPLYAPDAVGPFAVGRRSFTIVDPDREGRELPVDVWYPVDPEDATGDPSLYTAHHEPVRGLPVQGLRGGRRAVRAIPDPVVRSGVRA